MGFLPYSREGLLAWVLLLLLASECHGDCPKPEMPPHSKLDGVLNETYPIGATLKFTCIPGYFFIPGSKSSIECLENSTWSIIPTFCEIRKCKPPVIENGGIEESSSDLELGVEVTFICNEGYRLQGTNTARCILYDGNKVDWDRTPPICEHIPCERPPLIDNGTHSGDTSLDHYTVGTVVIYTCDKDLTLIGDTSLQCIVAEDGVNGKWDKPAPTCKAVKCSRPEIANGILTSGFQPSYDYQHRLQFKCNAGYTALESEFIECTANSTWYPEPKCIKVPIITTTVPVPPGGNETSRTTPSPRTTVSTVNPGSPQSPGATVSTVTTGTTTQKPGGNVPAVTPDPGSATVVVGKLVLVVALLILIM